MNADTLKKYREYRAEHPFVQAIYALRWAKAERASDKWEEDHDQRWVQEIEGFTVKLVVEDESIFPEITRGKNETDYGTYVDSRRSGYSSFDWGGNWPEPVEFAEFESVELGVTNHKQRRRHIRFPYTSIHYTGPGWVQGEEPGYFIPDGIEDQFEIYRRYGQARSVAWDMTKQWIEDQLTMLFSSPLTYVNVWIKIYKEDVELASVCMGTDVSSDDEGRQYIFQMVEEHGMVDEAIEHAKGKVEKLTA